MATHTRGWESAPTTRRTCPVLALIILMLCPPVASDGAAGQYSRDWHWLDVVPKHSSGCLVLGGWGIRAPPTTMKTVILAQTSRFRGAVSGDAQAVRDESDWRIASIAELTIA
jgi:hypothetical protein